MKTFKYWIPEKRNWNESSKQLYFAYFYILLLFIIILWWGETFPCGTVAANGPNVNPPNDTWVHMEQWWNVVYIILLAGETKGLGDKPIAVTLSTTNPTWIILCTNSGLQCEKPLTDCLSCGTTMLFMKTVDGHFSKYWALFTAWNTELYFNVCLCRGVTVCSPLQKEQHWLWEHFWATLALFSRVRDSPVKGKLCCVVELWTLKFSNAETVNVDSGLWYYIFLEQFIGS